MGKWAERCWVLGFEPRSYQKLIAFLRQTSRIKSGDSRGPPLPACGCSRSGLGKFARWVAGRGRCRPSFRGSRRACQRAPGARRLPGRVRGARRVQAGTRWSNRAVCWSGSPTADFASFAVVRTQGGARSRASLFSCGGATHRTRRGRSPAQCLEESQRMPGAWQWELCAWHTPWHLRT